MVPEKHYTRISGLNQTIHGALNIVGAPLGALLLALLPLHGVMLVDLATAAFAVIPLLFVFIPQPTREHVEAIKARSFLSNTLDGLKYVFSWPGLIALLVGASVVKIALMPAFSLVPLLVHQHFGGEAAQLSLFNATVGLGMMLGGMLLGVWGGFKRKIHTMLLGMGGIGVASVLLGLTPGSMLWLGLVSVFLIGLMISMTDAPIAALLQTTVPPEMQGRVFGLLGSLFSLTAPIGLMIAGPVADVTGVSFWFLIAGLLCIVTVLGGLFVRPLMHIEDQKANGSSVRAGEASGGEIQTLTPAPAPSTD